MNKLSPYTYNSEGFHNNAHCIPIMTAITSARVASAAFTDIPRANSRVSWESCMVIPIPARGLSKLPSKCSRKDVEELEEAGAGRRRGCGRGGVGVARGVWSSRARRAEAKEAKV